MGNGEKAEISKKRAERFVLSVIQDRGATTFCQSFETFSNRENVCKIVAVQPPRLCCVQKTFFCGACTEVTREQLVGVICVELS